MTAEDFVRRVHQAQNAIDLAAGCKPSYPDDIEPPRCPHCGLVMTWRERDEQGACNECCEDWWPIDTPEGWADDVS